MSLVLLLNLLIAMMGDTYQTTQGNSTLEWRVAYARRREPNAAPRAAF